MGSSIFPSSNLSNACFQGTCVQDYVFFPNPSAILQTDQFLILSVFTWSLAWARFPLYFLYFQRTLHSVAQHSESCWWFTGNDPSYWERSSFPGTTTFSEMAFILNWLATVFLACLIWHGYSLKQPFEEPRRAPALAASAVARICSPEAAAKEGATTQALEGFPIALTACCLKNDFAHLAVGSVALYIFIPAGGSAALFINNVGKSYSSGLSGVQRQQCAWLLF